MNLDVQPGQVVVVFGRSGSGKSTLLRCINFLEEPSEGTVEVAGIRVSGGGHRTRAKREQIRQLRIRTGMVFQENALFDSLTVAQNVAFRLTEEEEITEEQIDARVAEVLGFVGLSEFAERMPSALSGGC